MKRPLKRAYLAKTAAATSRTLSAWARRGQAKAKFAARRSLLDELRRSQADLRIQNQALKFSQAAAEGASERFVTLFSSVPMALMVVDERGQILEHNVRALALLRPLETDLALNFLFPLIPEPCWPQLREGFAKASELGHCELTELEFLAGSNGTVSGDLHIARVDSAQDESIRFICAVVDQRPLLQQREALQTSAQILQMRNVELQQNKTRLSAIIDASLDAIISVNASWQIIVFNPTAARLFDCPASQALGRSLECFLPDIMSHLHDGKFHRPAQLGEMQGVSSQGKKLPLEVSLAFENNAEGDIITLFAHDLSGRKRMQAHRDALEAQLREAQKMQAIGTMAGGIAHDFNNIISAILGNAALALQDEELCGATLASVHEIDKAGRRARDLVRQILTFSRHQPAQLVPLQLAGVLYESERLVQVTLPPQIRLELYIEPDTPVVLADATQVEQALLNLCNNAIYAIGPQAGWLRIELTHHQPAANASSDRRSGLRGHCVRLSVSDSGEGMSETTRERAFEPFFTTKPVGQGTGLGLSVVHGIMRAHQGEVQAQSRLGQGSVFSLLFPLPEVPAAVPVGTDKAACSVPAPAGHGEHVLYVDDDEALLFLVQRLLTRQGYVVHTFSDPRQALSALQNASLTVDLLVTDYNMPGFSGVDLLREVKKILPALPLALASGYVTPEIESAALAAGASALIYKPDDVDALCTTVEKLLRAARQRASG